MKLKIFQVREFRSVWNSEPINLEDVTCLVGKNEAGKTALLQALYRTNPIVPEDSKFDITYDYPKRKVEDYRFAVENEGKPHTVVVERKYELEDDDMDAVSNVFGANALKDSSLVLSTTHANKTTSNLNFDDSSARLHLARQGDLPVQLKESLEKATNWEEFKGELEKAERTPVITKLLELVTYCYINSASHYAFKKILHSRVPKFMYFDEYYQMTGRANINALIQRQLENKLKPSDHPLIGLINLARLQLNRLLRD